MANLTKDYVTQLIQKAPPGSSAGEVVQALVNAGNKIEGLNYKESDGTFYQPPQEIPETMGKDVGKVTQPQAEQKQGFLSKLGGFLFPEFTKEGAQQNLELGIGGLKSAGQTIVGAAQLGQKIGEPLTSAIGLPKGQPIEQPEFLKPKTQTEEVGKIAGDIGQFFIPGAQEEKAAATFEKFVAKYGPEAGSALNKLLNIAGKGAITGLSTGGVTAVQSGGDLEKVKTAAEFGFGAGVAGKALDVISPGLNKAIARSNLRLTDTQQAKLNIQADKAAKFISENKLWGTPSGQYNKLQKITKSFEDVVQSTFETGTAPKETLLKYLDEIPKEFESNDAIYQKVLSDVETAKKTIQAKPNEIPLKNILEGKRSWAGASVDASGNRILNDSKFAIQDAYYKTLEDHLAFSADSGKQVVQVPSGIQKYFGGKSEVPLKEFMAKYSEAVNASKFMNIAKEKSDVGFVGRMISGLSAAFAARALGPVGEIGGAYLGAEAASRGGTLVKSAFGRAATAGETTIPVATKAGLGLFNKDQPPQ